MRVKEKVVIFIAAAVLTLVGFSVIAAPSVELMRVGKEAGYQIIANYLEKAKSAAPRYAVKG
jgi:hypothetical protein